MSQLRVWLLNKRDYKGIMNKLFVKDSMLFIRDVQQKGPTFFLWKGNESFHVYFCIIYQPCKTETFSYLLAIL